MQVKCLTTGCLLLCAVLLSAQSTDTLKEANLKELTVSGIRTVRGTGHMPEVRDGIVYAGKKNEVILVDSLDANKAVNNTRQILGRIPGLNIVETESSGFTANGIATRGLNPSQSIDMNVRQNGYNISGDIFGYNESYYVPPMEAVERVEMVRGAASLQFGSQFGGLVNYVMRNAPKNKPFEFTTSQTMGNYGLFNSFNAIGGTLNRVSYYGFIQHRNMEGWRPNSRQTQVSGYGKISFKATDKLTLGAEYSLLRNRIQMPGGLTDSLFAADPRASLRARNWLKSPWNVATASAQYQISDRSSISLKTTYLAGNRALVWRNEEGGAGALDLIDPATGAYVPREVGKQAMRSSATEVRFSQQYNLGNISATLAAGGRFSQSYFHRQGGGQGTTGSDFDLSITGDYEYDLDFTTTNSAFFVENIFHLNSRLSLTPGFRFEYLNNTVKGYVTEEEVLQADKTNTRSLPLVGLGAAFKIGRNTDAYANFSQAYKPIDYSQLTPFGVTSRIDPNLKDASGFNADLGYRGTVKNYLNFDVGLFYMAYNNRIGLVLRQDTETGETYTLRTNIAASVHQGVETYVEFNPIKLVHETAHNSFSVFTSFAYTDARYTEGEFKGNRVETAAKIINRTGLLVYAGKFSATAQVNYTGDAFGDASNIRLSDDPAAGYIPAYTVIDLSATWKIRNFSVKTGVNNLADKAYFTKRADEYPGPGIIPAVGRSFYAGVSATF